MNQNCVQANTYLLRQYIFFIRLYLCSKICYLNVIFYCFENYGGCPVIPLTLWTDIFLSFFFVVKKGLSFKKNLWLFRHTMLCSNSLLMFLFLKKFSRFLCLYGQFSKKVTFILHFLSMQYQQFSIQLFYLLLRKELMTFQ